MIRAFIVVVGFCLLLVSCTQQMVCPAYQSSYIYDKDALRKKFSYFNEDSTPKIYASAPGKTKYLIAEPTSYRKKVRSLQTVPAKKVNTVLPDSLNPDKAITKAELDSSAQSIIDSTYIVDVPTDSSQVAEDSVYVITIDKEVRVLKYNFPDSLKYDPVTGKYVPEKPKYYIEEVGYNTEQDNYMWYLRDLLLLPDAKLSQQGQNEKEGSGKGTSKKKKGLKGLFAGLFKKKDKSKLEQDSTLTAEPVVEEDYGYDDFDGKQKDSTAVQSPPQQAQSQPTTKPKKGLFKKKDKSPKKKTEASPAKKEDEKGDGF